MPHPSLDSNRHSQSAFTLIELLVVIAIIAILAVVVMLTLNPAQLLAQSRDANRVSDMATLNSAINLYQTDQSGSSGYSLGNSTTSYLSLPSSASNCSSLGMASSAYNYACSTSANYRNASSSGWLPINFQNISSGSPFGSLPVDPVNQSSSNLYYSYETNGNQYVLSTFMESQKYAKNMASTGGVDPALYTLGSGANTLPDASRGLVGYWPLNQGQGTTLPDYSGFGNNAVITSAAQWAPGKMGNAVLISSSPAYSATINLSAGSLPTTTISVATWVDVPSFFNWPNIVSNAWGLAPGSWLLDSDVNGNMVFGITGPASTTQNNAAGCVVSPSNWYFVVGTYDGTTIKTYVNGVLCGSAPLSHQSLYAGGGVVATPGGAGSFYVDDIRIYNRPLSAAEIQEIYNAEK